MPTYTTERIKNLKTGEPFVFDVSNESLERLKDQKRLVTAGHAPALGSIENLVEMYELTFFPAYKELLQIFSENGFTIELITQILTDFGIDEAFIHKLLEDEDFISEVMPWFEGITCDGERAARTLGIVYGQAKCYYSVRAQPRTIP